MIDGGSEALLAGKVDQLMANVQLEIAATQFRNPGCNRCGRCQQGACIETQSGYQTAQGQALYKAPP